MHDRNNSNVGITEGTTEMLKEKAVKYLYDEVQDESMLPSAYTKETLLAKQISLLVGEDKYEEAFFSGEGIQPLKKMVKEYYSEHDNPDEVTDTLFEKIEDQYRLRENENQPGFTSTITADVQCVLLDGIETKISRDIESGVVKTEEEMAKEIGKYETCLLTPENLNLTSEEESRFPSLRERVTAKLDSIRQNLKQRVMPEQQKVEEAEEYDLPVTDEKPKKIVDDFDER